ncbi:MAG: CDP-diacylglycerol--glycerol-3-phosphate 3-phosphatidyltransferase [bacterium]|nr:CDP-diacylglycerol--glycerol-3-phosphate 3-phosphatidyltransferase [bacterium]
MFQFNQLANIITFTRILGVGLIFWVTPYTTNFWLLTAVLIFIFVALTDFLDGWVARRFNQVSDLGKMMDPLADKILVLIFLPLLEMQMITSFPVFIILAREFAIMALRVMAATKGGTVVAAQFSGKLKTALTFPLCGILMGRVPVDVVPNLPWILQPLEWLRQWVITWPQYVISVLVFLTVLVTIWSFLDYFGSFIWNFYMNARGLDNDEARRRVRSIVPNTFSFLNLACGLGAAVLAWYGNLHLAVLMVLLGTFLDAFDGALARKLDAFSEFGAALDSKADIASFGVAPAFLTYRFLTQFGVLWGWAGAALAIFYFISVQFRLRRFSRGGHSEFFEGLPSPAGAGAVVLYAICDFSLPPIYFVALVSMVCILMTSRIPYAHLDIAKKARFIFVLKWLTAITFPLAVLKFAGLPYAQDLYAYELLLSLVGLYLVSPLFFMFRHERTD